MKFCESHPFGVLHRVLAYPNAHGDSGLSYLESKKIAYVEDPKEVDFFVATNAQCPLNYILPRTILMVTEPYSRYKAMYSKQFRWPFGGFIGIHKDTVNSENEFYLVPQNYSEMVNPKDKQEHFLALIHQRYKREHRNLAGDIERERAVNFFDQALGESFHTYGRVWHKTLPWNNSGWKGTLPGSIMGNEKISTLSNYKFVLCFENSRENGYISEKIFSAFLSGSVPIYFGAPDISSYIPKDCYIEFDGTDYNALLTRMQSIDNHEYQEMRMRARQFLVSSECEKFTSIGLAKILEKTFTELQSASSKFYTLDNFMRRFILSYCKLKLKYSG